MTAMLYVPIHSNVQSVPVVREIASNIHKIPSRFETLDSENYFTHWEIEQINESLSDYESGNYKTFSNIKDLLEDLHS